MEPEHGFISSYQLVAALIHEAVGCRVNRKAPDEHGFMSAYIKAGGFSAEQICSIIYGKIVCIGIF